MSKPKEYALYKGDTLLSIGTVAELAKRFGVKKDTIKFYGSKAYMKHRVKDGSNRRILVAL